MTCLCHDVVLNNGGREVVGRNWNPDCPEHPWNDKMQAQSDRSVSLQQIAGRRRRGEMTLEEAQLAVKELGFHSGY